MARRTPRVCHSQTVYIYVPSVGKLRWSANNQTVKEGGRQFILRRAERDSARRWMCRQHEPLVLVSIRKTYNKTTQRIIMNKLHRPLALAALIGFSFPFSTPAQTGGYVETDLVVNKKVGAVPE